MKKSSNASPALNPSERKRFEDEYAKIMDGASTPYTPIAPIQQYNFTGYFFEKFSLYTEIPSSIASTDSLMNTGF
jgi:hypothetical protein